MADYPCDFHGARYNGESTRAFLNLYQGNSKASFRASVCGDCLAELVTHWLESALVRDELGRWILPSGGLTLEEAWETRTEATEAFPGVSRL